MKFVICASILSATLFKYASAACAGAYAQCGGNNFNGDKCCQSGFKCVTINEWYSQCEVDNSAPANNSPANDAPTSNAAPWENNNNNQWGNNQPQNPWGNNNNNQWGNNQPQNPWGNNNNNQWGNNQPQNPWGNNNNQWGNNNNQQQNPWENNNQWGNNNNQWNQQQQNQPQNQQQQPDQQQNQQQQPDQSQNQQQQPNQSQNQQQQPDQQQNQQQNQQQQNQQQQNNTPAPAPAAGGSGSSQNFFVNEIYANPKFIEEIDSSMSKLDGELKAKAEKVKSVPTAVWLAWDGAPGEVAQHLKAAGSKTVVFILYMIPTRDCNSNASAGGAGSLETYKGYVNDIANTIKSNPSSKVVMVVEPDTLGNLVTGSSESCKNVHTLHKNALSYAVNVFGAMSNVSVYLDAAHGKWLGGVTDKVAAVIKEILSNAPNGKIRGLSTNVSNYQPVSSEYSYHQKLASSLAAVGVPDMHFIVDTGRNGVDISEAFNKSETWCNFIGTGFGERPKGNPNPGMPLLDAYMWLKTPGEADGSSTGSRADPVCARADSLPGSPDAGQWFHDYFVQLLKNAKPGF